MKKLLFLFLLIPFLSQGQQLQLPFGIKVLNPEPPDGYFYNTSKIPYVSTTQANTQILSSVRYIGQTVLIGTIEYCYKTGITDGDLVIKNVGGGGVSTFTALIDGPGSYTGRSLNFVRVNVGETGLEYQTLAQVKSNMSLNLVDNTSDASKPVSTLQAIADALNLKIASNLSDLANASTARTNLGLGSAATISSTAGGDLSGTLPSPTVVKINGNTVPANAAGVLTNNGSGTLTWAGAGGTGTVTNVSSADANATVATQTTTPVITIVSAPKLATARTINGTSFDGTANITTTAASGTLTGSTLNSTVTASSLTSVGTLTGLTSSGQITENVTSTFNSSGFFSFQGDSKTQPVSVGIIRRWSSILSNLYGYVETNVALGGKKMQGDFELNLSLIPSKGSNGKALFIWLGANDLISDSTVYTPAGYSTATQAAVNNAISSKGWAASDIVLMSPSYTVETQWPFASLRRQRVYKDTLRNIASRYHTLFVDLYTPTKIAYQKSGPSSTIDSGGLHETNDGQDLVARLTQQVLTLAVTNRSQGVAVNDLLEAKQLRLYGGGQFATQTGVGQKVNVMAMDKDGTLKVLPYNQVVQNVHQDSLAQAASINVAGYIRTPQVNIGGSTGASFWAAVANTVTLGAPDRSTYRNLQLNNISALGTVSVTGNVIGSGVTMRMGGTFGLEVLNNATSAYMDIIGKSIDLRGGLKAASASTTVAKTLTKADFYQQVDNTTLAFNITLPTAASVGGTMFVIKKIDATANNTTIVTTSSQTIDGNANWVLSGKNSWVILVSDGSNWKVISSGGGSTAVGYVAKTASYTLTANDNTVEVTTGTNTQTLPTAVGAQGTTYTITNSGSGVVTVATTSSQTFVNVSGTPTSQTLNQFQVGTYRSNGANWLKISGL